MFRVRCSIAFAVAMFALAVNGCVQKKKNPTPQNKPSESAQKRQAAEEARKIERLTAAAPNWNPADESKGYLHKASGIGIVFPNGWKKLDLKETARDTTLAIMKEEGEVAVFTWTPHDWESGVGGVGNGLYTSLRTSFVDRVELPEPVEFAGHLGFRLRLTGGPKGSNDPKLVGVVYAFGLQRKVNTWVLSIQTMAHSRKNLDANANDLLEGLRID